MEKSGKTNGHVIQTSRRQFCHQTSRDLRYTRSMSVSSYIPGASGGNHRIFLTICMYACFLALGLVGSVMGPTIVHMQHLLNTDLQGLTLTFTYQRVGYLIGVAISGLLFDRLNQEIQFAIVSLLEGFTVSIAPWMPTIYGYYGVMTVQSLLHGYINTGTQSFMIGLWEGRKHKRPVIQGGAAMWSLGASLCPFVVSPFLIDLPGSRGPLVPEITTVDDSSINIIVNSTINNTLNNGTDSVFENISNVRYAYFIVGMSMSVISLLFFIAFCLHGASCDNDGVTITKEKPKLHGDTFGFKFPMLIMLFFFFVFYIWYEGVPGGLISAFVIQGLNWPVHKGPLITSVYYGAHGIGRVVGIPVSMCLSAGAMLVCNLTLTMAAFIVMYLAPMADTDVFMWLAAAMAGFAMSTTFASMLLWVSNHMTITGAAGSVFLMGTSTGGMTGAALVGHLFQTHTHMWVVYLSIAACTAHIVLYAFMYAFAHFHKRKYETEHLNHKDIQEPFCKNNNQKLYEPTENSDAPLTSCGATTIDIENSTDSVCSQLPCVHQNNTCNCLNFQLRQASNMM